MPLLCNVFLLSLAEKVRSIPRIVYIFEQNEPVYVGSNKLLFCTILTKDRNTKFRWYYNPSNVPDGKKLGKLINQSLYHLWRHPTDDSWPKWRFSLKLTNLSVANSGLYGCQAENVVGNGSRQTYLKVTNRPITPSATGMENCTVLYRGELAIVSNHDDHGEMFEPNCLELMVNLIFKTKQLRTAKMPNTKIRVPRDWFSLFVSYFWINSFFVEPPGRCFFFYSWIL